MKCTRNVRACDLGVCRMVIFPLMFFGMSVGAQAQQTWTTNGNGTSWSVPANWTTSGGAPVGTCPTQGNGGKLYSGQKVVINHDIFWDMSDSPIWEAGSEVIVQGPGTPDPEDRPTFFISNGKNLVNKGTFSVLYANLIQEIFIGGDPAALGSGTCTNEGGTVRMIGASVEIAQDWVNKNGYRYFESGCLRTGQNYSNDGGTDTLINVCMIIGQQSSGNFQVNGDAILHVSGGDVMLQDGNGNFELNSGLITGTFDNVMNEDCWSGCTPAGGNECSGSCSGSIKTSSSVEPGSYVTISNWCHNEVIDDANILTLGVEDCDITALAFPCTECDNALMSVELLSFSVHPTIRTVVVRWTAANEIDNAYFVVEQSADGQTFADIGTVNGRGAGAAIAAYEFTDANPFPGVSYYRLRQVDYDGQQTFSGIRTVRFASEKIAVHPNPSPGLFRLSIGDYPALDVQIVSELNQTLHTQRVSPGQLIDISFLPDGMYTIVIYAEDTGERLAARRVIKIE